MENGFGLWKLTWLFLGIIILDFGWICDELALALTMTFQEWMVL